MAPTKTTECGNTSAFAVAVSALVTILLFAGLLAGLLTGTRTAAAQAAPILPANPTSAPQTYFVQFEPSTSPAVRDASLAQMNAEMVAWLPQIGVAEVRLRDGEFNAASAAAGAPITFIEPDVAVSGDFAVSDPGYNHPEQGYGQHLLGVDSAWNVTRGSEDVVIAIIDSGINPKHPEFAGRIVPGYDFINSDTDPTDDHGHGTHVAGIAAAGINGLGTVGVCPACKIMPIKVLNQRNGGTWGTVSKGILFAVDNGADVINLSLGATISSTTLMSSVQYAIEHNVVVVAAAGNLANNAPFYPAAAPGVIGVSGTDSADRFWPVSDYGTYIDVAAPGVNIYSAYHDLTNTSGYAYMSGTSMASPFVTGLVGLIRSRQPNLTVAEVTDLMGQTAADLGDSGWDPYYGYGRVDAYRALVAANDGVDPTRSHPGSGAGSLPPKLYLPAVTAN